MNSVVKVGGFFVTKNEANRGGVINNGDVRRTMNRDYEEVIHLDNNQESNNSVSFQLDLKK